MFKIILIILLIILIFLYFKYKYYIGLYFSSNKNYNHYRLSDMVTANNTIRYNIMGKRYHLKYYPGSIASKYLLATDKRSDIDTLIKIIDTYKPEIKPLEEELVVHLRVGEVLNHSKYSVDEFLEKERNFEINSPINYVKPLSYYQKIIDNHKELLPKKIKIFSGGCFCDSKLKSYEYTKKIKQFFIDNGFEIIESNSFNNPDDDFVYMARSKHFIQSGGGFSDFISKVIERKKGKIYKK